MGVVQVKDRVIVADISFKAVSKKAKRRIWKYYLVKDCHARIHSNRLFAYPELMEKRVAKHAGLEPSKLDILITGYLKKDDCGYAFQ